MKYKKYIGALAAFMMTLASCQDHTFNEYGEGELSDEVTVSFTLCPEAASTSSRAGDDEEADDSDSPIRIKAIGDGSNCDMLIYAVYDVDGNLLEQYRREPDPELVALGFNPGSGQTIMKVDKFPATVNITLKRGTQYQIAFWAQSSTNAKGERNLAYNTDDLRKVEVIYGETVTQEENAPSEDDDASSNIDADSGSGSASDTGNGGGNVANTSTPNNDEYRDAFCRAVNVKLGASSTLQQNVYLYRPLAQINIGTAGYDYEIVTRDAVRKYIYSKIRINRVARYLDVVSDRVYSSTTDPDHSFSGDKTPEAFAVVDFGYALLPAYNNYQKPGQGDTYPTYPSFTKFEWEYDPDFNNNLPHDDMSLEEYEQEQFLRVHHIDDASRADIDPKFIDEQGYVKYANLIDRPDKPTETFKYLSMCYVLTSSTQEDPIVINNIKVWLATDPNGANEVEILNIDHVPAQRNWRTNIVGELLTEENTFNVKLDRDFAGDYSGWQADEGWEWSGPIDEGVYYNSVTDEIEISSIEGLIWLQRMVNGDLKVRELRPSNGFRYEVYDEYDNNYTPKRKAEKGDNYWYYNTDRKKGPTGSVELKYNAIKQSDYTPEVQQRILRATHQIGKNGGKGTWPENNNFHFCGQYDSDPEAEGHVDDRAKVKLMADIDLTGIEWIPIGFDGRICEGSRYQFAEDNAFLAPNVKVDASASGTYVENCADGRGFFGKFDGNGHTIFNLSTKRFSAQVHSAFLQSESANGPYDVPQWFGRGLFGMIGGCAEINNVKLVNVDIYGCQCIGGVVGAAQGDKIKITNCIVDGGEITATPMYRGDGHNINRRDRTFARGVYTGGIVGYFNTVGGILDDNVVKNLTIKGYRRIGGITGSIGNLDLGDIVDTQALSGFREPNPASISRNIITNSTLIASQYSIFGVATQRSKHEAAYKQGEILLGTNWDDGVYNLYANKIVGGHVTDLDQRMPSICRDNDTGGLVFSEFTIAKNPKYEYQRISDIQESKLENLPMLSGWYADSILLHANYYGKPSARTRFTESLFQFMSYDEGKGRRVGWQGPYLTELKNGSRSLRDGINTFKVPWNAPREVDVQWVEASPKAGVWVGCVSLDGKGGIGERSVITPTDVDTEGACAMFVTGEDRYQFETDNYIFKRPVNIRNVVLRGSPYAYCGMLVAPVKTITELNLYNVAIYDVYKTIAIDYALQPYSSNHLYSWPYYREASTDNDCGIVQRSSLLNVTKCNLRGYTEPGNLWKQIYFKETTFEAGVNCNVSEPGDDEEDPNEIDRHLSKPLKRERTLKIEEIPDANDNPPKPQYPKMIIFESCFFKAPYYIDLTGVDDFSKILFTDPKGNPSTRSYATATSKKNVPISLAGCDGKDGNPKCTMIKISSSAQGNPIVEYYSGQTIVKTEGGDD